MEALNIYIYLYILILRCKRSRIENSITNGVISASFCEREATIGDGDRLKSKDGKETSVNRSEDEGWGFSVQGLNGGGGEGDRSLYKNNRRKARKIKPSHTLENTTVWYRSTRIILFFPSFNEIRLKP